jgi:hypothetical protein
LHKDNFFIKFILSCQEFAALLTPTTLSKLVEKFVTGVVDTGGAP